MTNKFSMLTPALRVFCCIFVIQCLLGMTQASVKAYKQEEEQQETDVLEKAYRDFKEERQKRSDAFGEVRERLSNQMSDEDRAFVLDTLGKAMQDWEAAEYKVMEHERRYDEDRFVNRMKIEEIQKAYHDAREELEAEKERSYNWMIEAGAKANSLELIQGWFAHALRSIDEPELQNWVLAHLASSSETLVQLARASDLEIEYDSDARPRELELALRELRESGNPAFRDQANEMLQTLFPESEFRGQAPTTTSSWSIVAEPKRDAERQLIQALDRKGEFYFFDTPLGEVMQYCEVIFDVAIIIEEVELELMAVELDYPITLEKESLSLRSGLKQMLAPLGLTFIVRDEAIVVTSEEAVAKKPARRVYDLTHHRLVQDEASVTELKNQLQEMLGDDVAKLVVVGKRLAVSANEDGHYELAKLLTLMHQGE